MTVLDLHRHVDIRRQLVLIIHRAERKPCRSDIVFAVMRSGHLGTAIGRDFNLWARRHLCSGICLGGNLVFRLRLRNDLGISARQHSRLGIHPRRNLLLRLRIRNYLDIRTRLHLRLRVQSPWQLGEHHHASQHATHRLDRELKHGKQLFQRLLIHRHTVFFWCRTTVLKKLTYTIQRLRKFYRLISLHGGLIKLCIMCIHRRELLVRDIRHVLFLITSPPSARTGEGQLLTLSVE